jgi:hypothetical protein
VTDDYLQHKFFERYYQKHPDATPGQVKQAWKNWVSHIFERDVRRKGVTIR